MFLVDGLGYELLRDHADQAPFLHALLAGPQPGHRRGALDDRDQPDLAGHRADARARHGVVGFTSRIPGTDDLLNALTWSKAVDPREWQPHPTALGRLAAAGVHTTVVNKREFAGSGLTVAGQRGAEFVGADKVGERMAAVRRRLAARPVADLPVRRRPRLDRAPVRRRLDVRGSSSSR